MVDDDYADALLAAALKYAAAGLYVFPVRVVRVSSADGDRKKVWPIGTWRNASTRDESTIRQWYTGAAWRGTSLAIDCGKSGLVVLDGDGDAGMAALHELAEQGMPIGSAAGTPGGGQHWFYAADPERPISIDSSGKVAPGVDVRGVGGFVIAAPSRDWRGAYRWADEPKYWDGLDQIPEIIIDRMGAKRTPDLQLNDFGGPQSTESQDQSTRSPDVFDVPERQFTMADAVAFCQPYLDRLRDAQVGQINSRLNEAAKVLSHFLGPFWSAQQAQASLLERLGSTAYDGATWKAEDTIASAFRSAASDWRAVLADPFDTAASAPPEPSAVDALDAEFLTPDQVVERPPPTPLILDWLDLDSLAWLIGKPGSYKSFLVLDWAAHVGAGLPWRGHRVEQGNVDYIVAEGVTGMSLRVRAWQDRHGPMKGVRFLPRPVQASGPEWAVLVEVERRRAPKLIILDTQARVTVGMDENDNTEMGQFIHRAEELRAATGACVLIVHHIGRNGEDARGASALDGAQSTEIKISRSADGPLRAVIEQDKQKDMAEAEPVNVKLAKVELGRDPVTGRELSSLVLAPVDPFDTAGLRRVRDWIDNLASNQAELVGVMMDHFPRIGATKAELRTALAERRDHAGRPAMAKSSYYKTWDELVAREIFIQVRGTQRFMIDSENSVTDSSDTSKNVGPS